MPRPTRYGDRITADFAEQHAVNGITSQPRTRVHVGEFEESGGKFFQRKRIPSVPGGQGLILARSVGQDSIIGVIRFFP